MKNNDFTIVLCGYKNSNHTNWYPWFKFDEVFEYLGYDHIWWNSGEPLTIKGRRLFICWNEPISNELVSSGIYKTGDIILQKVTALGKYDPHVNWGSNPGEFFKTWKWTTHRIVEELLDKDINIYAFGCRTNTELFEEKKRIADKLGDRFFQIPWGSSLYSMKEINDAVPIMDGFKQDLGFVGSVWGRVGRGNIDSWTDYMQPILRGTKTHALAGIGLPESPANDPRHKEIIKTSALCPIINASAWRAEEGVQDRFWSVFTSGRFGVVDSLGIYQFFNEDEVVCETDPGEYVEKSLYYFNNIDKQLPFIEKAQKRIKEEYNYYITWSNIIEKIKKDN
jgi:hypothetical protein